MSSIALQLKESTRDAHNSAENHEFQQKLGSGNLPRSVYADYLSQLYLVHNALENAMETESYCGPVVSEPQLQTGFLKRDLHALNIDVHQIKPTEAAQQILQKIERTKATEPVALLGYHYVLLGSKHGGKFIASTSKKSYDFPGDGAVYFDPYGQEFQQHWKHFVDGINNLELNDEQVKATLQAASDMFNCVQNIGAELQIASQAVKQ